MKAIHLLTALLSSLASAPHGVAASAPARPASVSAAAVLLLLPSLAAVARAKKDEPECQSWADAGECNNNPELMREHCPHACQAQYDDDDEIDDDDDDDDALIDDDDDDEINQDHHDYDYTH